MLLKSYEEGRLLVFAKGWTVEAVAEEIAAKPELAEYELAASTLHRYMATSRHIPPPIARIIEGLATQPKREHLTEIVESGLRVLRGQPTSSKQDPDELAKAVLAHFPADELALKLAEALTRQAGHSSGTGSLFDVFSRAIADRLPRLPRLREQKLAHRLARRLDRLSPKRLVMAGVAGGVAGAVVASIVFVLGAVIIAQLFLSGRLQVLATRAAETPKPPEVGQAPEPTKAVNVPNLPRQASGAFPPPSSERFLASALAGLKMPDKPEPTWLKPGKDGRCRNPKTGEELRTQAVIRGTCWRVSAKLDGDASCPDGLYDPPPEVLRDKTPRNKYLHESCFVPYDVGAQSIER
jgi:hypothetical protein